MRHEKTQRTSSSTCSLCRTAGGAACLLGLRLSQQRHATRCDAPGVVISIDCWLLLPPKMYPARSLKPAPPAGAAGDSNGSRSRSSSCRRCIGQMARYAAHPAGKRYRPPAGDASNNSMEARMHANHNGQQGRASCRFCYAWSTIPVGASQAAVGMQQQQSYAHLSHLALLSLPQCMAGSAVAHSHGPP